MRCPKYLDTCFARHMPWYIHHKLIGGVYGGEYWIVINVYFAVFEVVTVDGEYSPVGGEGGARYRINDGVHDNCIGKRSLCRIIIGGNYFDDIGNSICSGTMIGVALADRTPYPHGAIIEQRCRNSIAGTDINDSPGDITGGNRFVDSDGIGCLAITAPTDHRTSAEERQ